MSGEKRRFVVVRRHENDVYGETRVTVCARTVEAASAEEAASEDMGGSVVELRVIPVDDVPAIGLAAVRAWREAKWKREQEEEERDELEHALEVVARHREKMAEVKQLTTDEQNTAYVRAALAYDATYLDGSTLIAPGVTLAEALAEPERVVRPVWEAALRVTRIPWGGPVDFDGIARVANSSMIRGGVEPSTLASIGLRVLRVMTQRESEK